MAEREVLVSPLVDVIPEYHQAWALLAPAALREWLRGQPRTRLIGKGGSVLGGVLATYLTWATMHFWYVGPQHFWRFADPESARQHLPSWAFAFQRWEALYPEGLTVADALAILDRLG